MRLPTGVFALVVAMGAGVATLAQQGGADIRGSRGAGRGDLPPMRREMPPQQDQRSGPGRQTPPMQPERPPGELRPPAEPPADRPPIDRGDGGREPIVNVIEKGPRANDSVGTAFAIDADGNWVTAHHVVDGCRMVYFFVRGDWLPVTVLSTHEFADVAVGRTRVAGEPMQVAAAEPLRVDQDGFQYGFPQFKPAATHVKLLGRVRVSREKRGGQMEVAYSWAEVARRPDFEGTLGGISGGPIVDARGVVVGVNILESSRRGRVTTSSPDSIHQTLVKARVAARVVAPVNTDPENFDARADAARSAFSVARVFCAFHKDSAPPRVRRG